MGTNKRTWSIHGIAPSLPDMNSPTQVPIGRWFCLELDLVVSTVGNAKVFVDGVNVLEWPNVNVIGDHVDRLSGKITLYAGLENNDFSAHNPQTTFYDDLAAVTLPGTTPHNDPIIGCSPQ
jgi:hypothetical protein